MKCPNCGNNDAIALFTSIQCSNYNCQNYNQTHASETAMKGFEVRGTWTGRISCKEPNFSNLPRTKEPLTMQSLRKILLSMQEENKRLRADNHKLAEVIRKVETGDLNRAPDIANKKYGMSFQKLFDHQKKLFIRLHGVNGVIPTIPTTDYVIPTRWT